MIDMCKECKIPDRAGGIDPYESEYYFSCSDCVCHTCPHLHACNGQCVGG